MKPRFSVITPVLNGYRDAPAFVESLQRQRFTDWEAIVIDDGSTDGTMEILHRLTAGDSRFRLTRNTMPRQVQSPYQARNVGLNLALGKFICFLDIDDRWLPEKLAFQAAQLDANPGLQLLYSAYVRARRGASGCKVRRAAPMLSPKCCIHLANPIPMLTTCVHRDAILDIRFEPQHHEDFLFWHAVIRRLKAEQIKETHHPLAIYYIHGGSISSNKLQASVWIWKCYKHFGYSHLLAVAALLARGLIQAWLIAREASEPNLKLEDLKA